MSRLLNQNGDTLVEVVLSIAMISIVMVSGFNISGQAYQVGMLAKERTEAVSLAQQQAERMRIVRDNNIINKVPNVFNGLPADNQRLRADLSIDSTCPPGGCVEGIFKVQLDEKPNSFPGVDGDLKSYSIKVEWVRAGSASDKNESVLDFSLADKRIQKADCSVVEMC